MRLKRWSPGRAWRSIRSSRRPLSLRERALLLCLLGLAAVWGAGRLVETLHRTPQRELRAAVAEAEDRVLRNAALLARADRIHERFGRLGTPSAGAADSLRSETAVLRELSRLAGGGVRVRSLVPRRGGRDGATELLVALDCEGPFASVMGYVERILDGMPSEIGSLSLTPSADVEGGVACRVSLRVGGIDATTDG